MGLLVSINGVDFEPYAAAEYKLPLVGRKQLSQRVEPIRRDIRKPGEFQEKLKHTPPNKRGPEVYKEVAAETTRHTNRKAIHAHDLMSSPVHCLKESQSIAEAMELFRSQNIRHAPIVNESGTIQAMLSDRNLLMANKESKLSEIISLNIVAAEADTLLTDITRAMLDHRIHSIPILNKDKEPVGIITSTDILESVLLNPNLDLLI